MEIFELNEKVEDAQNEKEKEEILKEVSVINGGMSTVASVYYSSFPSTHVSLVISPICTCSSLVK